MDWIIVRWQDREGLWTVARDEKQKHWTGTLKRALASALKEK